MIKRGGSKMSINEKLKKLIQGDTNKILNESTQDQYFYTETLWQREIEKVYNQYPQYENHSFDSLEEEVIFYSNYARMTLYYAQSQKAKLGLSKRDGVIVKPKMNISPLLLREIDNIEKLLNKAIELTETGEKLNRSIIHSQFKNQFIELAIDLKKLTYYELATIYMRYKSVEQGIEYFKKAVEYGSFNSLGFLVYLFTREDYLDCEKASQYYESLKSMLDKLPNPNKMLYYMSSTLNMTEMLESIGQYEDVIKILEEFSDVTKIKLDKQNSTELSPEVIFSEIYNRCKLKLEKTESYETKENIISKYFSNDIIQMMTDDIKIYIETSLKVDNYLKTLNKEQNITLDYSSVTMPILKAVECLLKTIINHYLNYLHQLKKDNKLNLKDIDNYMLNDNGVTLKKQFNGFLEIGRAYFALFEKPNVEEYETSLDIKHTPTKITPRETFVNFCKSLNTDISEDKLIKLGELLKSVRTYRNRSAHNARVFQEYSDKCLQILVYDLINLIKMIYDIFKPIF